eukprot:TRINITY_DN14630_c0_g1_i1.p1 TRINITY_DN14630_c0_g1~~TRINITY_DN14630_c0_g1_i1.p1  ORF type:complete len:1655 (+),score=509.61 TRINITY_DN14630_c0_g1_i1:71-5035(+)
MAGAAVAFDLGSQTARVSVHVDGRTSDAAVPAAAAQTEELLVGRAAQREVETRHRNVLLHLTAGLGQGRRYRLRHMRTEREVSVELALAMLLTELAAKASKLSNAAAVGNVAVVVPSALRGVHVAGIERAASAAGLPRPLIIPSPLAAVHGANLPAGAKCVVVDAGCRYTSVAVVEAGVLPVLLSSASLCQGGFHVDEAVMRALRVIGDGDRPAAVSGVHPCLLRNAVEKGKKELSALQDTLVKAARWSAPLTRRELDAAAAEYYTALGGALREATAAFTHDITHAVLVGGAGRSPRVKTLVATLDGTRRASAPLNIEVSDFDYAAVRGAAKYLAAAPPAAIPLPPGTLTGSYWAVPAAAAAPPTRLVFTASGTRTAAQLPEDTAYIYHHRGAPCAADVTCLPPAGVVETVDAPEDACCARDDDEVTCEYAVSGEGREVTLWAGQVLQGAGVAAVGAWTAADVAGEVQDVAAEAQRVREVGEKRNALEEAHLLVEEEGVAEDYVEYVGLAKDWLDAKAPETPDVADLDTLTQYLSILADGGGAVPSEKEEEALGLSLTLSSHMLSRSLRCGSEGDKDKDGRQQKGGAAGSFATSGQGSEVWALPPSASATAAAFTSINVPNAAPAPAGGKAVPQGSAASDCITSHASQPPFLNVFPVDTSEHHATPSDDGTLNSSLRRAGASPKKLLLAVSPSDDGLTSAGESTSRRPPRSPLKSSLRVDSGAARPSDDDFFAPVDLSAVRVSGYRAGKKHDREKEQEDTASAQETCLSPGTVGLRARRQRSVTFAGGESAPDGDGEKKKGLATAALFGLLPAQRDDDKLSSSACSPRRRQSATPLSSPAGSAASLASSGRERRRTIAFSLFEGGGSPRSPASSLRSPVLTKEVEPPEPRLTVPEPAAGGAGGTEAKAPTLCFTPRGRRTLSSSLLSPRLAEAAEPAKDPPAKSPRAMKQADAAPRRRRAGTVAGSAPATGTPRGRRKSIAESRAATATALAAAALKEEGSPQGSPRDSPRLSPTWVPKNSPKSTPKGTPKTPPLDPTSRIAQLQAQKVAAVAEEDYLEAARLKQAIDALRAQSQHLALLHEKKAAAVEAEDYLEANRLKLLISTEQARDATTPERPAPAEAAPSPCPQTSFGRKQHKAGAELASTHSDVRGQYKQVVKERQEAERMKGVVEPLPHDASESPLRLTPQKAKRKPRQRAATTVLPRAASLSTPRSPPSTASRSPERDPPRVVKLPGARKRGASTASKGKDGSSPTTAAMRPRSPPPRQLDPELLASVPSSPEVPSLSASVVLESRGVERVSSVLDRGTTRSASALASDAEAAPHDDAEDDTLFVMLGEAAVAAVPEVGAAVPPDEIPRLTVDAVPVYLKHQASPGQGSDSMRAAPVQGQGAPQAPEDRPETPEGPADAADAEGSAAVEEIDENAEAEIEPPPVEPSAVEEEPPLPEEPKKLPTPAEPPAVTAAPPAQDAPVRHAVCGSPAADTPRPRGTLPTHVEVLQSPERKHERGQNASAQPLVPTDSGCVSPRARHTPVIALPTRTEWAQVVARTTSVSFRSGGGELVEFAAGAAGTVVLRVDGRTLVEAVRLKYDHKREQLIAYERGDARGTGGALPPHEKHMFLMQLSAVAAHAGVPCKRFGYDHQLALLGAAQAAQFPA